MFCSKCGAEVPEGDAFCAKCGNKISEDEVFNQVAASVSAEAEKLEPAEPKKPESAEPDKESTEDPEKNNNNTLLIIGIIGFAVMAAIMILLVSIIGKPGINLTSDKTVKVEFTGGEERGRAGYVVDEDVITKLGEKTLGKKPSAEKSLLWLGFVASISYKIEPDSGLKNGDKVRLTVEWDKNTAKKLNIGVKGKERTFTVSGLEPATEVDAFASLEVSYEGYDGNGRLVMNNTATDDFGGSVHFEAEKSEGLSNGDSIKVTAAVSDYILDNYNYVLRETEKEYVVEGLDEMTGLDLFEDLSLDYEGTSPYASLSLRKNSDNEFIDYYVYFEADKTTNIANGDVITVTASVDENSAKEHGFNIGETTKQYTVENLDEYLKSYSDITEDVMEKMKTQAEDAIETWTSNQERNYSYQELKIKKPEHVADYFLKLKDGLSYNSWSYSYENSVYMCYKVEERYKEGGSVKNREVYLIVRFDNFIKYEDGTVYVEISSAKVDGTTYDSYEDLYEKAIRGKKQDYVIEEKK